MLITMFTRVLMIAPLPTAMQTPFSNSWSQDSVLRPFWQACSMQHVCTSYTVFSFFRLKRTPGRHKHPTAVYILSKGPAFTISPVFPIGSSRLHKLGKPPGNVHVST